MDKRNRNALHYAVESGCVEACEVILDNAQARGCSADLINKRELYLGSDQCFLVRGKKIYLAGVPCMSLHSSHMDWKTCKMGKLFPVRGVLNIQHSNQVFFRNQVCHARTVAQVHVYIFNWDYTYVFLHVQCMVVRFTCQGITNVSIHTHKLINNVCVCLCHSANVGHFQAGHGTGKSWKRVNLVVNFSRENKGNLGKTQGIFQISLKIKYFKVNCPVIN